MGIVAKCPISLKMTPLKGRGCTSPSFSVQICRACLAIGIEYQLLLTRLSIKLINCRCTSLIQVCARVTKNQETAENLVFGALPLVLGVPNFPKLV